MRPGGAESLLSAPARVMRPSDAAGVMGSSNGGGKESNPAAGLPSGRDLPLRASLYRPLLSLEVWITCRAWLPTDAGAGVALVYPVVIVDFAALAARCLAGDLLGLAGLEPACLAGWGRRVELVGWDVAAGREHLREYRADLLEDVGVVWDDDAQVGVGDAALALGIGVDHDRAAGMGMFDLAGDDLAVHRFDCDPLCVIEQGYNDAFTSHG